MKKHYFRTKTILFWSMLIFLTGSASAQDYARLLDEGIRTFKVNAVFLKVYSVQNEGAHLKKDQFILVIGPLGPDHQYRLVPVNFKGAPDHIWEYDSHQANRLGAPGSKYYLANIAVKPTSHMPAECADHQMVMKIVDEDDNGPKDVEIWGADCSVSGSDHGGTAHANR